MQAVILAAGVGVRLHAASNGHPKCLMNIDGRALIERQLEVLERFCITRVCVVLGYEASRIQAAIGDRCECVINTRYAGTNSLYSLSLARDFVNGPFILLNGDVLAHPDIFHRVLAVQASALAYDSTSGHESEHMRVSVHNGLVRAIGKDIPTGEVSGENVGVLRFDSDSALQLFAEAEKILADGGEQRWAPAAVHQLACYSQIHAIDIAGLPWIEIDFPEDLGRARLQVWPRINSSSSMDQRGIGCNLRPAV